MADCFARKAEVSDESPDQDTKIIDEATSRQRQTEFPTTSAEPKTDVRPRLMSHVKPKPKSGCLQEEDVPTDLLLTLVARHIMPEYVTVIATELGLEVPEIECIKYDNVLSSLNQITQVLTSWKRRSINITTGELVTHIKHWRAKNYISHQVWDEIRNELDFEIPVETSEISPVLTQQSLSPDRQKTIQQLTKRSLKEKPFSTATGKVWLETKQQRKMSLEKIYTKLSLVQKERGISSVKRIELDDITSLFNEKIVQHDSRILVTGIGGVGKSTALKYLALAWANGSSEELEKFDFIFHVALRSIQEEQTLEEIIVKEHKQLKANNVDPVEIKQILRGETETEQKVLLLLDGHDEYKPGTNMDIDNALTKDSFPQCCILLTSRDGDELTPLRDHMDAEAEITGFDDKGIVEYITRFLESEKKCDDLIVQCCKNRICAFNFLHGRIDDFGFLKIPILLHMICVLYLREISLPETRTGIINAIVERCQDWEKIRKTGRKTDQMLKAALQTTLVKLGKLTWTRLQCGDKSLVFSKADILDSVGEEALSLGLLMGTEGDPREEEQQEVLSFHHLLIMEFVAGKYISTLPKDELAVLFPDLFSIKKHREVIQFACGLTTADDLKKHLSEFCCLSSCTSNDMGLLVHNFRENESYSHDMFSELISTTEKLSLMNRSMTQVELRCLSEAISHDKLPQLKELRLEDNTLTGCLKDLLGGPDHSGFHSVEKLNLRKLNQKDVTSLSEAVSHKKLPKLKKLDLSRNNLTGCLKDLFGGADHPGFPSLEKLDFSNTKLNENDMTSLSQAVSHKKLPQLKKVELGFNTLTGCLKNLLGRQDHPGFPSLEELNLAGTQLNQNDMKGLSEAVSYKKLPQLKKVELASNTLTGCLKNLLGRPDHPGFPSLEELNLAGTQLNQNDLKGLSEAVCHKKLPKLKKLGLNGNNLTGCLKDLFGGPDHPGFPSLDWLELCHTKLNQNDLRSLSEAVSKTMLPQLKNLNLWGNTMTGCLKYLLGGPNHPGFPGLETLYLMDTALNQADMKSLSKAVSCNKIPKLKGLFLHRNTLTGCLKDLLGRPDHPGFPFLRRLGLRNTGLDQNDLKSLSEAVSNEKLPQLRELPLDGNTLTSWLKYLFGRPDHPGFPSLRNLGIVNTGLDLTDLRSLSEAFDSDKLPKLFLLYLKENSLSDMEDEVERLVAAYDAHFQRNVIGVVDCLSDTEDEDEDEDEDSGICLIRKVVLLTENTNISEEFKRRCSDRYPHVYIKITSIDVPQSTDQILDRYHAPS